MHADAPWCGHCKRLAPILEEIATRSTAEGLRFGKVDCTTEKSVCTRYKANSFPTLKIFHEGMEWEHRGARSAGALEALRADEALCRVVCQRHLVDGQQMLCRGERTRPDRRSQRAEAHGKENDRRRGGGGSAIRRREYRWGQRQRASEKCKGRCGDAILGAGTHDRHHAE